MPSDQSRNLLPAIHHLEALYGAWGEYLPALLWLLCDALVAGGGSVRGVPAADQSVSDGVRPIPSEVLGHLAWLACYRHLVAAVEQLGIASALLQADECPVASGLRASCDQPMHQLLRC